MLTRTTTALLEGLLDPADEETWRAFDERYRPILVAFALRLGVQAEDAADAAQEALVRFVGAYRAGRYDRDRGRLRSWIIGITRNCVRDLQQKRTARHELGLSAAAELPDEATLTRVWEEECEHAILRRGLEELRSETRTGEATIRAFELVALDSMPPARVAAELGLSLNDVYLAKHRCLKRLRSILSRLEQLYEVRP